MSFWYPHNMDTIADRLAAARRLAGFKNPTDAARRFAWKYSTYSGHENGSRNPSRPTAKKYADAYNVDVAWLLYGRGKAPEGESNLWAGNGKLEYPVQPVRESVGFAEAQIMAWKPKDEAAAESIVRLLVPSAKTPSTFLLGAPIPELFYNDGDVLIVEQSAGAAAEGDIIIANKVDYEADTATTIIGKKVGPYIVPPDPKGKPTMVDATVNIVGPVISSFREPKT